MRTLEEEGRALVDALPGLVGELADLFDGGEEVVEREAELPRGGGVLALEVGQQELTHAQVLRRRAAGGVVWSAIEAEHELAECRRVGRLTFSYFWRMTSASLRLLTPAASISFIAVRYSRNSGEMAPMAGAMSTTAESPSVQRGGSRGSRGSTPQ